MNEKDGFDKVEVAVKKTTKIIVLIIGSVVTISLAMVIAMDQIKGKPVEDVKIDSSVVIVTDTMMNNIIDTVLVVDDIDVEPIRHNEYKIPEKVDKVDKVINGVDKVWKLKEKL